MITTQQCNLAKDNAKITRGEHFAGINFGFSGSSYSGTNCWEIFIDRVLNWISLLVGFCWFSLCPSKNIHT